MRRANFLAGTGSAGLALGAPLCAEAAPAFHDIVAASTGALSLYVRTMDGVVRYALDSDEQFPSASTIKLVIMLTAFRAYELGDATPQTPVRIHASDLVGGSDFLRYAKPGAIYQMGTLVQHMIRQSDNSASNALISHFGFERINTTAAKAGMARTHLKRHFLDYTAIVKHNDNLTTAHDLAMILYQTERSARDGIATVAEPESCRKMIEILLGQEDRNKIPAGLPRKTPVANKTGEIDGVRNDAAIVDPFGSFPYVIVVLTKHLEDESSGTAAISRISRRVYDTLTRS
ncbi:MAG TPA: serine hydrolase [Candidatus Binatia bacterium]|nr:serine hydrolase [Candidatus Binatia bacterium]